MGYCFRKHHKGVAAVIFFLFFAFLDGPFLEADSASYLTMNVFREPGYPLFLLFCRLLPGAARFAYEGYAGVWYAVILQSLLWACAASRFTLLAEEAARNAGCGDNAARFAGWAALLLQFAVPLLNRFASARGAMYSDSILTEALAMPLYTLFVCFLFYLMRDGGKRDLLRCALCALLLITIRKHMTVVLLLWGFAACVIRLVMKGTRQVRTFLIHCAVIVAVFFVSQLFTRCYNLAFFETFSPQAGSSEGMMCMLLYTAEETDAVCFAEDEAQQREWFEAIAAQQKERGARFADAPVGEGWIVRYEYFMNRYDEIGYGIVHDILFAAAGEEMGTDAPYELKTRRMYELEGTLVPGLLRQDLRDYVRVYADNLLAGLLYSNARVTGVLFPVSVLLYLAYIILFVWNLRDRNRISPGKGDMSASGRDAELIAFLVLAGLLINAVTVAAFIFSQPRYNSYSMAMFYTVLLFMAYRFWYNKTRNMIVRGGTDKYAV